MESGSTAAIGLNAGLLATKLLYAVYLTALRPQVGMPKRAGSFSSHSECVMAQPPPGLCLALATSSPHPLTWSTLSMETFNAPLNPHLPPCHTYFPHPPSLPLPMPAGLSDSVRGRLDRRLA